MFKRYFKKPVSSWEVVYCLVGIPLVIILVILKILTLGALQVGEISMDWYDYCSRKGKF